MANDTAKRVMARVKELRQALKLSQEAFAERAGLKYKHYQSIEAGRKIDFRFSTLEKMAKVCGLEIWELLNFDSDPIPLAEERKNVFHVGGRKEAKRATKSRSNGS